MTIAHISIALEYVLPDILFHIPLFIAWLVGGLFAIRSWDLVPRVSLLIITAILLSVFGFVIEIFVAAIHVMVANEGAHYDFTAIRILSIINGIKSLANTSSFAALLAATFLKQRPIATTELQF